MILGNKILLFFHPMKKVTFFHGKILKPISDVKFVNTVGSRYNDSRYNDNSRYNDIL